MTVLVERRREGAAQALEARVAALEAWKAACEEAGQLPSGDPDVLPEITDVMELVNVGEHGVIVGPGPFLVTGKGLTWDDEDEDEGFFMLYAGREIRCDQYGDPTGDPTKVLLYNVEPFDDDGVPLQLFFRKRVQAEGYPGGLYTEIKYAGELVSAVRYA